jgi:hypothetical protein
VSKNHQPASKKLTPSSIPWPAVGYTTLNIDQFQITLWCGATKVASKQDISLSRFGLRVALARMGMRIL